MLQAVIECWAPDSGLLTPHARSPHAGLCNAQQFADMTNQDLTKFRCVKADWRGTDFSGANLRVRAPRAPGCCPGRAAPAQRRRARGSQIHPSTAGGSAWARSQRAATRTGRMP